MPGHSAFDGSGEQTLVHVKDENTRVDVLDRAASPARCLHTDASRITSPPVQKDSIGVPLATLHMLAKTGNVRVGQMF